VEFSVDAGETWRDATLAEPAGGPDAWVRWRASFDLRTGTKMTLLARSTDGSGDVQEQAFTLPEPDGGTGWPGVEVTT
jgi:hypothetical protein